MGKLKEKGFTLMEVLAVLVIIGILLLLIVPNVLKDVMDSKDEYNDKLTHQLELAGKSYYSDHKSELPTSTSEKAYSYVTLPEMKSQNYVTNEFVDSEGNECSPSYVYVRQKSYNSSEYQYVSCLVCQDKDGKQISYSDNAYCKISNWDDKEAPKCKAKTVDYTENGSDSVSKWKLENVSDNAGIMAVIIRNKKTGDYKALDVSEFFENAKTEAEKNAAYQKIMGLYLRDEVSKYFDTNKRGQYEVVLLDFGGNESENSCLDFDVQIDECVGYRERTKIVLETATSQYGFKTLNYKLGNEKGFIKNISGKEYYDYEVDATDIPNGATLYFEDIKGNNIYCPGTETDLGTPKCKFTKTPKSDYVGPNGTTIEASCTLCQGEVCSNVKVLDKTLITAKKGGTISNISVSPSSGVGRNIIFTFKYTAPDNKVGLDTISIGAGTVSNANDSSKTNYESLVDLKYDTEKPKITYGPINGTLIKVEPPNSAYAGWGYQDSISRTVSCTDSVSDSSAYSEVAPSGVKNFVVNSSSVLDWKKHLVTFSGRGTHSLTTSCEDIAGNKVNGPSESYRILQYTADCNVCGGVYAKCCTKHQKCCNKCNKVCSSYKTTTTTSCVWWVKGNGSSSYERSTAKCSKAGQTQYNSGAQMECRCSTSTSKTCSGYTRPSSCSKSGCASGHWDRYASCACESGYSKRDASCGWESCNSCWW